MIAESVFFDRTAGCNNKYGIGYSSTNYLTTNILFENIWKKPCKTTQLLFFSLTKSKTFDVFSDTTYLLTTFHTNHRVDSRQSLNQFELFELLLNIDSHCHFIIFLST